MRRLLVRARCQVFGHEDTLYSSDSDYYVMALIACRDCGQVAPPWAQVAVPHLLNKAFSQLGQQINDAFASMVPAFQQATEALKVFALNLGDAMRDALEKFLGKDSDEGIAR
jgi:hypothetical protein